MRNKAQGTIKAAVYLESALNPITSPRANAHLLLPVSKAITRQTKLKAQNGICTWL